MKKNFISIFSTHMKWLLIIRFYCKGVAWKFKRACIVGSYKEHSIHYSLVVIFNFSITEILVLFFIVFTQPGLEKAPTYQVPQSEIFRVPKPGTVNWEGAGQDHVNLVGETMSRLQQKVNQRRILCKPCFQDFDRYASVFMFSHQNLEKIL